MGVDYYGHIYGDDLALTFDAPGFAQLTQNDLSNYGDPSDGFDASLLQAMQAEQQILTLIDLIDGPVGIVLGYDAVLDENPIAEQTPSLDANLAALTGNVHNFTSLVDPGEAPPASGGGPPAQNPSQSSPPCSGDPPTASDSGPRTLTNVLTVSGQLPDSNSSIVVYPLNPSSTTYPKRYVASVWDNHCKDVPVDKMQVWETDSGLVKVSTDIPATMTPDVWYHIVVDLQHARKEGQGAIFGIQLEGFDPLYMAILYSETAAG